MYHFSPLLMKASHENSVSLPLPRGKPECGPHALKLVSGENRASWNAMEKPLTTTVLKTGSALRQKIDLSWRQGEVGDSSLWEEKKLRQTRAACYILLTQLRDEKGSRGFKWVLRLSPTESPHSVGGGGKGLLSPLFIMLMKSLGRTLWEAALEMGLCPLLLFRPKGVLPKCYTR